MEPASAVCSSCGKSLRPGAGRCRECGRWQPEAAWDRALYYAFALLTALAMGLSWWLRQGTGSPTTLAELQLAWLHPLVIVPLALTVVFALRVWKHR